MGKQINSAKKMENNSKTIHESLDKKESRKIDDYFNLGNRKRNRDESEISKDDRVLKPNNKVNNETNNIAPLLKDKISDLKGKIIKNYCLNFFNYYNLQRNIL